jgi:hypothetical protein
MSIASNDLLISEGSRQDLSADECIRAQVWSVLGAVYNQGEIVERRNDTRYPFPYLVYLTSVGEDGLSPAGEPIVVVGKTLSERGFGFYHRKPLADRRMVVSFEDAENRPISFLIDLTWCCFTRQGWYESGGRFLQAVASPEHLMGF